MSKRHLGTGPEQASCTRPPKATRSDSRSTLIRQRGHPGQLARGGHNNHVQETGSIKNTAPKGLARCRKQSPFQIGQTVTMDDEFLVRFHPIRRQRRKQDRCNNKHGIPPQPVAVNTEQERADNNNSLRVTGKKVSPVFAAGIAKHGSRVVQLLLLERRQIQRESPILTVAVDFRQLPESSCGRRPDGALASRPTDFTQDGKPKTLVMQPPRRTRALRYNAHQTLYSRTKNAEN